MAFYLILQLSFNLAHLWLLIYFLSIYLSFRSPTSSFSSGYIVTLLLFLLNSKHHLDSSFAVNEKKKAVEPGNRKIFMINNRTYTKLANEIIKVDIRDSEIFFFNFASSIYI